MNFTKYIPSFLTSMNLASGFAAILINDPYISPLVILLGAFFDLLDGAAARKLNATSDFGGELDSLADLVSFGVAPAYLYYNHVLQSSDKIMAAISVSFIVIFAAMRLAKFNIDTEQKSNFIGVPSPASGIFFAMMVFESNSQKLFNYHHNTLIWILLPIVFGLLMVSPFKFYALKKSEQKYNSAFKTIILTTFGVCGIIWLITGYPAIPFAFVLYILMSFFYYNYIVKS
ncbi:MAG: CDP-diacylglycerol--serine O-phosphatidyltransferase [Saprospiraceae bacterium]|nr:CDP-diacylglycerol--serine O-phosphatidyltransferase [Saprospiraceae bacterium]